MRDAAALGSAILAAVGVRAYKGFEEAVENMVHISEVYQPNPSAHETYQKIMERYWKIYEAMG